MKKQMKKIIALVCAMALAITGIAFVPNAANADDTWIHCDRKTTVPDATPDDPYPEHTCWYLVSSFTGGANGNMDYCWINHDQSSSDPGKIKFRKNYSGLGDDGEPLDLSYGWDIAKLEEYGTDPLHPLSTGKTYKATIKINSSAATEVSSTGKKCKLAVSVFGTAAETTLKAGENTLEVSDIEYDPDDSKKRTIDFNLVQLPLRGEITVTSINIVEDTDAFIPVPNTESATSDGYVPSKDGVSSPWSLRATDNGSTQYGRQGYKFNAEAGSASTVQGMLIKLVNTVGEQETYPSGQPVEPKDRWWWTAGNLINYASKAGLTKPFASYTGSITFNTTMATDTDCRLFVYVDGEEYPFALTQGANTLNIPEFIYKGGKDIKFLFDELPKGAIVSVSNISFTEVSGGEWNTVPNEDPTFTEGPWNMFGNFIAEPGSGNYGVLQYKANKTNPSEYNDYSFRVPSNSGWLAWSVFARLENYMADYYDFGDPYDITITLYSSKDTPVAKQPGEQGYDPNALTQLIVVIGKDMHYFDLEGEKDNVLHMTGTYSVNEFEPHEQILFEMDGLALGTELTVKDIKINDGPNEGWTNVPNKKDTTVGDWTMYASWDETHWSKMAYRDNGKDSGIGSLDFKIRRTTKDATQMACTASLDNYLATAKDDKGYSISSGDTYNTKVTINASGLDSSVTDYGKVRAVINGKDFTFKLKKGTNTYDLHEITGEYFTYNDQVSKAVRFGFDETKEKSIINISDVKFYDQNVPGTDVPNDEAFNPEGTPWTLYAITDARQDLWGALKYTIEGDPAVLSSLKINTKSVSGWFGAYSTFASLVDRLEGFKNGTKYRFTIKANIDESNAEDNKGEYVKALRITINEKNFDYELPKTISGVQTFEGTFTYDSSLHSDNVAFQFDQMLKGTVFSVNSVEIVEDSTPTSETQTTTKKETTTQPTSTTQPSSKETSTPESSPVTETPTVKPTTVPTSVTPSTVRPTSDETTTDQKTTTKKKAKKVKKPRKAKIKKVYKRKKSAKKLKVRLKKIKRAKGYQIAVYKTKKNAKKNKKALKKKYTKKLKTTIKSKKFKKKKKLYVRARAYVLNKKGKKVFGKWSKIKVGKTKKAKKKKKRYSYY